MTDVECDLILYIKLIDPFTVLSGFDTSFLTISPNY